MTPWSKGERHKSWASNGNVAVYIFCILFAAWMVFQIWARLGGGPAPAGLDPMVMAALGVAITTKSVEKKTEEREVRRDAAAVRERVDDLEDLARAQHPEDAAKRLPHGGTEDGDSDV